ncbi:MAG: HAD family phosphatase [candidate division KSB1 bacterium]|nr:HAD family phosphatase [candidate division KSB1 bacterium]MDZ7346759.1 HAD family phosphatase [candidate division KSB1 bacterium]
MFDNDGVLVDTEKLFFEANRAALAEIGVELKLKDFCEISLRQGKSCLETALKGQAEEGFLSTLRVRRDALYEQLLMAETAERQGIREVLENLRGRCRFGVVTNAKRRHFEIMHARTSLLPYFSFVLTLEDFRFRKPHPDPYLTALRLYSLQPSETLSVEDSERGVRSAAAAGLRCIAAPTDLTRDGDFLAFQRIEDLSQLIEIVQNL